jgi:antitoxin component YwqK of YwqJK toxin-antitoxin module
MFENDLEHGTGTTFFRNGEPSKSENFVHGIKNGPFTEWYRTGKVKSEGTLLDGELDGKIVQYHPNGVKMATGKYVNGQMDGSWMIFHSSGIIELNMLYDNGVQKKVKRENGTFSDNYDSGIPKSEYTYQDGKKHGPFKEWHDVGEWVREPLSDSNPRVEAQFVEKLKGTALLCEGDYVKDHLEGEITYYNDKGRIIKIEYYSGGELESSEER